MATTSSQRPWEMSSPAPGQAISAKGQLPSIAALTSDLPAGSSGVSSPTSTRDRDSGAWSSQPQSTRSSAYSNNTSSYTFPSNTNSYYMSPNRGSTLSNSSNFGATSHPSGDYSIPPTSSSALGSPGFSTTSALPSLNQSHDPNRLSQDFPPQESRRSSLGSQVNQGMGSLHINGASSPYNGERSVNHSSTSLAQSLSRERGISGSHGLRSARSTAQLPMSPLSPPAEQRPSHARIAPPIGRNPPPNTYNGEEPVPGQAYAFPDGEPGALPPKMNASRHNVSTISNLTSNPSEGDRESSVFSRRDSGHQSIASSILTSDSRLPPGQHRLEDSSMLGTHHHSLQSNQMSKLDEDSVMSADESAQPYSRTPALRVSHKMAERKRRSEMKDLFENLRSQIPSNQGSKSSKWEILTKASDYIKQLEGVASTNQVAEKQLRLACHDLDLSRRDVDTLRNDNQRLLQELQMLRTQAAQQQQQPPAPHSQPTSIYGTPQHYVPPPPPPPPAALQDPARSLPPLTNNGINASGMQGIQYHER